MQRRVVIEDIAHARALAPGVTLLMLADLNRGITRLGCGHDAAAGEIRLETISGLRRVVAGAPGQAADR